MKAIILAAACLCACASPDGPAMSEGGAVELEEAISQWTAALGPVPGCAAHPVVVIHAESVVNVECVAPGATATGEIGGCLPDIDRHIVINEVYQHRAASIVTHEAMHWLAGCSGLYPELQYLHDDPEIWDAGGVLAATNDALGLPEQTGSTL